MKREWITRRWIVNSEGEVWLDVTYRGEQPAITGEKDVGGKPATESGVDGQAPPSGDSEGGVADGVDPSPEPPSGRDEQVGSTDWLIIERPSPRRRRSRHNAVKHLAYGNGIPFIAYGPLKEDPEEVMAFYRSVEADLQPGESAILRAQAREIASLQWRLVRLRKWEVDGYSLPESQTEEYEPDRSAYFASEREIASEVLERLGDRGLGRDDISRTLGALVQVTKRADLALITTIERLKGREQMLSALVAFVDEFYDGDLARAQSRLEAEAKVLRQREWEGRHWDSLVSARVEMSSHFTRSLLDAIARTSRELDRAMARFRLTKQTLTNME